MPIGFDPRWEYYEPSPEVAEIFRQRRPTAIDLFDARTEGNRWNRGLRFGSGDPDRPFFRLAPERHRQAPREYPLGECRSCGRWFRQDCRRRKHCGDDACRPDDGRPRTLPDRPCDRCGKRYRPRRSARRFCSDGCAVVALAAARRRAGLDSVPDGFREMYGAGVPVSAIAAHFGVNPQTPKRWRRKLGLPPRPSGNHSLAGRVGA